MIRECCDVWSTIPEMAIPCITHNPYYFMLTSYPYCVQERGFTRQIDFLGVATTTVAGIRCHATREMTARRKTVTKYGFKD